jgi:hypothetical protein
MVIWRLVSPFDGSLPERPPQRVASRSGKLGIRGLPLHLRSKEVVVAMIAGFATLAEDVEIGFLEGDDHVLNVWVDVFKAGFVPEKLILSCGGSSWLLILSFLMDSTYGGLNQNNASYAEVVKP